MAFIQHTHRYALALSACIALASTAATAQPQAATTSPASPTTRIDKNAAGSTYVSAPSRAYPPSEAGVRRAAAQGPEALRRYIWRTRMIYNYYYWDFARR